MLSLVFGAASLCSAATITYNVAQTVGPGSVTGFIETDGTIGVLGTSNILDFNLLLSDGTASVDDLRSNSVFEVIGSDLSATSTQLLFNFSGSDTGFVIFERGGFVGANFFCAATASATSFCDTAPPAAEILQVTGPLLTSPMSGTQVIASAAGASAPEPSTLGLLVAGIALLGFRKFRWNEAASRD
jgi:hypothetical protein